jgi:hypothetical protein
MVVTLGLALPLRGAGAAGADQEAPGTSTRKTSFSVTPLPFYNPNQGLGL